MGQDTAPLPIIEVVDIGDPFVGANRFSLKRSGILAAPGYHGNIRVTPDTRDLLLHPVNG